MSSPCGRAHPSHKTESSKPPSHKNRQVNQERSQLKKRLVNQEPASETTNNDSLSQIQERNSPIAFEHYASFWRWRPIRYAEMPAARSRQAECILKLQGSFGWLISLAPFLRTNCFQIRPVKSLTKRFRKVSSVSVRRYKQN